MKMNNCTFTYPVNETPTLFDISVQVSLSSRIACVAQHAFHHIESHLTKTPNEYIRWRYANQGEDKESLVKVTMQFSEEELALQKTPYAIQFTDEETGKITKVK